MLFPKSPRCQLIPLADEQFVFSIGGRERLRWHGSASAPRPFLFPLIGPSGLPLTRMGHPGAPNHDHHRSIWFAHHQVLGIDFWSSQSEATIRQTGWLAIEDGDDDAKLAVQLQWFDGHDPQPLIDQQVIFVVSPASDDGLLVEIQTSLRSVADSIELGQTNFGLLALRVAKSISAVFGDGVLRGDDAREGERHLFGTRSRWMDYSGSVEPGVTEGITYFDHADNLHYPNKWHVRDDGWMGASICFDGPILLHRDEPTLWRYLLHAHGGGLNPVAANQMSDSFNASAALSIAKSAQPHRHYSISRGE